ncbi:MAG: Gram-negative bacterial TonB protein C-terminal [Verrucomicrobiota bacterium]|jgi:hypothetical protein
MRILALSIIAFFAVANSTFAQTIDTKGASESSTPVFRPALIGTGPNALINRINTKELIAKGQKNGVVMFICAVRKTGDVEWSGTYRVSGDVQMLEQELQRNLATSANPTLIPALFNHTPVGAIYFGTVTFAVVDGKPRLRIFSNQQIDEVNKESDFIGPQPIIGAGSKFTSFHYPLMGEGTISVDGFVEVQLKVDEKGNLKELKIAREVPPLSGFGIAAVADLGGAKFIPAFRNGKPVACDVTVPIYYRAPDF